MHKLNKIYIKDIDKLNKYKTKSLPLRSRCQEGRLPLGSGKIFSDMEVSQASLRK